MISFTINSKPIPASRPRVFKNGGRSYAKTHIQYCELIKPILIDNKPPEPISNLINVEIEFVFSRYKTGNALANRSDLDNCAKIILDCATDTGFWIDDYLISDLHLTKRFCNKDETPHTNIHIKELKYINNINKEGEEANDKTIN